MGRLRENPMMRGPAVLLLLWAVALANGQSSAMKEIMEGIDMYNFRARCWGEANVDRQIAALETAKKICMQVASPLERFGSFARVRPFFSSSKMDHANNILSVLQRGGDISNLGSLWRSKRDTFDFDSINGLGNGNGILNPEDDDPRQQDQPGSLHHRADWGVFLFLWDGLQHQGLCSVRPRVEEEVLGGGPGLLQARPELAPELPQQEPHHQAFRQAHDLLQMRR